MEWYSLNVCVHKMYNIKYLTNIHLCFLFDSNNGPVIVMMANKACVL